MIVGLIRGLSDGLIRGLIYGMRNGMGAGFIVVGVGGLRGPTMDNKTKPNHGIWKSARNAGIITLIFGLILGLIFGLIGNFWNMLLAGLLAGLTAGLIGGGSACLRHFSMRLMLYRMGYAPWNYARFLDYAAERLFLQKVGGGYIFIHRMLLEHFAQMELALKYPK